MSDDTPALDRRLVLGAGLITGLAAPALAQAPVGPRAILPALAGTEPRLPADTGADMTAALQRQIDAASPTGTPVALPPGRVRVRALTLRPGTRLVGTSGASVLELISGPALLTAAGARDIRLHGLVLDGHLAPLAGARRGALVALRDCHGLALHGLDVRGSVANGIVLERCSGRVSDCEFIAPGEAGLMSLDAGGLEVSHNRVRGALNNGILVWRTAEGDDGTIVTANRIEEIRAEAGGSGQNGNGINVFRAGGVLVTGNRIAGCAYSAVRGNAASNLQIVANACRAIGEVALYAEFGFEGAVIASNLVDTAATGISVTNFDHGGRLAVVQGNLVRNLKRREHEPVDTRGEGIAVEADAAVSGNVVEESPAVAIQIGWGRFQRQVAVTGNLVRNARVGIGFQRHPDAGSVLVANNMISGAREGAIRAMDRADPVGADLARAPSPDPRWSITGNLVG